MASRTMKLVQNPIFSADSKHIVYAAWLIRGSLYSTVPRAAFSGREGSTIQPPNGQHRHIVIKADKLGDKQMRELSARTENCTTK